MSTTTMGRPLPRPSIAPLLASPAWPVSPAALVLLAMALGGLGLTVLGRPPSPPAEGAPATVIETEAADYPAAGDLPIIGDPIRDLTIWWSNRLSDANRGGIDNLRGSFLTPTDPLADPTTTDLYGKMLIVVVPILALGGIVLGYLIMTSRTTGASAYEVRRVTPRFTIGATLSVLGIFLVSVVAQFVTTTDLAMVAVSLPEGSVGGPDAWPAAGGVFAVLQQTGFDPQLGEGPGVWNTGAWLSGGLLAAILMTFLQMMNAILGALERLLVLFGPICLAAYSLPATQRITNGWLKALGAILVVRFAWSLVFVLFSLESLGHLDAAGLPASSGDLNAMLGLAMGATALMLLLPIVLVPLAISGSGPLRTDGDG